MTKLNWMPLVAALGLLLGVSAMKASAADADAAGKGTVVGTVLDKDGNPAAEVAIRLVKPRENAPRPQAAEGDHKRPAMPAVAEGKTDAQGKFELKDVPAGKYMLLAMKREAGFARQEVTVTAGETTKVELKLAQRAARK